MLRHMALVSTDIWVEYITIIRVTAADVPNSLILSTLVMEEMCSSKMSFLTRAIWRHTPEDSIISDLLFTII
jgi:hypothetical protein